MSKLCSKILGHHHLDDQFRYLSDPFQFIGLPLYSVLTFILYWLIYCPLVFIKVRSYCIVSHSDWPKEWPYFFWIVAFFIYLILMSLLVCLWKLKLPQKRQNKKLFQISIIDNKEDSTEEKIESIKEKNYDGNSLKLKIVPSSEPVISEEPFITPITPLTPREIFFHNLIESANRAECNSSTQIIRSSIESSDKEKEFFIANVTPSKVCVSNAFIYVDKTGSDTCDNALIHVDVQECK